MLHVKLNGSKFIIVSKIKEDAFEEEPYRQLVAIFTNANEELIEFICQDLETSINFTIIKQTPDGLKEENFAFPGVEAMKTNGYLFKGNGQPGLMFGKLEIPLENKVYDKGIQTLNEIKNNYSINILKEVQTFIDNVDFDNNKVNIEKLKKVVKNCEALLDSHKKGDINISDKDLQTLSSFKSTAIFNIPHNFFLWAKNPNLEIEQTNLFDKLPSELKFKIFEEVGFENGVKFPNFHDDAMEAMGANSNLAVQE
ncbi:MAG: hypothetical protein K0R02_41 [Rickettsiaceae bacterium]|jgi:hypothetical protein|nr:hypothetical protein [Rickettsiaceae bacterium]